MSDSAAAKKSARDLIKAEFDGKDKNHYATIDSNPALIQSLLQSVTDDDIEREPKKDNE